MQRKYQPMTAFFRKLFRHHKPEPHLRPGDACSLRCVASPGFVAAPGLLMFLGEMPMVVDTPLMVLFTVLCLVGGISFGYLYRHMQKQQEVLSARAQNAEEELRAMFTMTDDAVLLLDGHGGIRAVNPASEELFLRSEDDFAGEELTKLVQHPLHLAELTKNGPANFDATALRADGTTLRVEVLLSQVQHAHGTSYLALVHEKHRDASATVPVPDISATICKHSHDINNQLTGIVGHLSLILMSAQTDPAVHERIVSAKKNTLRAQETNRKLQAVARGESADPGEANSPAPGTIVPMPMGQPAHANGTNGNAAAPRVLVLDDEEAICALVTAALGAQGVEVTEATGAEVALRACEQAKQSGRPFHLVIADLSLPNDMSGEEAVRKLREIDPDLKAVVSSGYDQDPIMSDFRRHGFDAALAKPYELGKLGRVVREVLETSGSSSRKTA